MKLNINIWTFEDTCTEYGMQSVYVCVVTQKAVILGAPSPSPHLGWLNIVSFQPGLGE